MHTYLHIQEAPQTDSISADGHVGSRLPWPVAADKDGMVAVPSSRLGMRRVVGFQRDLAVMQVDLSWPEVLADPQQAVGMYLVSENTDGRYQVSLSAVDSIGACEHAERLPVER